MKNLLTGLFALAISMSVNPAVKAQDTLSVEPNSPTPDYYTGSNGAMYSGYLATPDNPETFPPVYVERLPNRSPQTKNTPDYILPTYSEPSDNDAPDSAVEVLPKGTFNNGSSNVPISDPNITKPVTDLGFPKTPPLFKEPIKLPVKNPNTPIFTKPVKPVTPSKPIFALPVKPKTDVPVPPKPPGKLIKRQCGYFTAYSPGNSGSYTANGKNVYNIPHKFLAHWTLPFGTKVYEDKDPKSSNDNMKLGTLLGIVEDRGPAPWTGNVLDTWFSDDYKAIQYGRQFKCFGAYK